MLNKLLKVIIKVTSLLCITIVLSTNLHAQQAVTTSGGNASGTGGSVSYSAGQVSYITINGASGSVAQGVQQPFEISVITGIYLNEIILSVSAYPNPVSDELKLSVTNIESDNIDFRIIDLSGNLLRKTKVVSDETTISFSEHISGTYFLVISIDNRAVKTFKIVKK